MIETGEAIDCCMMPTMTTSHSSVIVADQ